ncbi:MAG: isoaspartyl peptidase/L-asparaginase [Candidatus Binatia bacterium]
MRPSIVVHGGAGARDSDTEPARAAAVDAAAAAGWDILSGGGSSLDAVVAAVTRLENDPLFNAGLGAVLTEDGTVELDASLMSGIDLRASAVAMVRGVCNPILLARAVMDEGREVFLVGPPAEALARRHGLRVVAPEALVTAEARGHWEARRPSIGETVGAAACDAHGHVAAATSTGGVGGQRSGRVGDSAVIGAGTYADDTLGAASATGPGEAIIRVGLVRTALEAIARGADAATAADEALAVLSRRVGAAAGIILVDRHGRIAAAHTTPAMVTAQRSGPACEG